MNLSLVSRWAGGCDRKDCKGAITTSRVTKKISREWQRVSGCAWDGVVLVDSSELNNVEWVGEPYVLDGNGKMRKWDKKEQGGIGLLWGFANDSTGAQLWVKDQTIMTKCAMGNTYRKRTKLWGSGSKWIQLGGKPRPCSPKSVGCWVCTKLDRWIQIMLCTTELICANLLHYLIIGRKIFGYPFITYWVVIIWQIGLKTWAT
jgi:hypothetical protein